MKKLFLTIGLIVVAMFLSAVLTGCSHDDEIGNNNGGGGKSGTYQLTVKATKGSNQALTRALSISGSTLTATWKSGETVTVYKSSDLNNSIGTLTAQSDGASTTLSGTISNLTEGGNNLTLKFLSPSYSSQDGTLEYIAQHCDYAVATITATNTSGTIITTDATFDNQQAIVKFNLKNWQGNDLSAKPLKITGTDLDITVNPTAATNSLFVALSNVSGTLGLTATGNDNLEYTYSKTDPGFVNGKYYEVNVSMYNPAVQPLTIEATVDDVLVNFTNKKGNLQYRKNNGEWTPYSNSIELDAGQKVSFRGDAATYYDNTNSPSTITCDKTCYVYGNIMSLLYNTDFASKTALTNDEKHDYTFSHLFSAESPNNINSSTILSHPNKELLLPAIELAKNCYEYMFYGCVSLERAPVLPASALVSGCYNGMFYGCTNLKYIKCLAEITADDISSGTYTKSWVTDIPDNNGGKFISKINQGWTVKVNDDNGKPSGWDIMSE